MAFCPWRRLPLAPRHEVLGCSFPPAGLLSEGSNTFPPNSVSAPSGSSAASCQLHAGDGHTPAPAGLLSWAPPSPATRQTNALVAKSHDSGGILAGTPADLGRGTTPVSPFPPAAKPPRGRAQRYRASLPETPSDRYNEPLIRDWHNQAKHCIRQGPYRVCLERHF